MIDFTKPTSWEDNPNNPDNPQNPNNVSFPGHKNNPDNNVNILQEHVNEAFDIDVMEAVTEGKRAYGKKYKRIAAAITTLDDMGCNPIQGMARIALNSEKDLAKITKQIKNFEHTDDKRLDFEILAHLQKLKAISINNMSDMNKELAAYVFPKLKSVEHTGHIEVNLNPLEELMHKIEGTVLRPTLTNPIENVDFVSIEETTKNISEQDEE